jgi:uncharacterized protein (DUF952 family)
MQIFHITDLVTWEKGRSNDEFISPSLFDVGFIHCCRANQIDFVLDRWFSGQANLIIVTLGLEKIKSNVKFEYSEGDQESFPHIYGPIPIDAVESIKPIIREKK